MKNSKFIFRFIVGIHIVALIGTIGLSIYLIGKYIDDTIKEPIQIVGTFAGALGLYMFIAASARHLYAIDQEKQKHLFVKDQEMKRQSFEEERFNHEKRVQAWKQDLQEGTLNKIATETESRNKMSLSIGQNIAKILTEDHGWANTAIKNAYLHPYKATEFQKRTHHYSLEKEHLGKSFAKYIVRYLRTELKNKSLKRIYILVDSGSTFVPFMRHLAIEFAKQNEIASLAERIRVVTNNLAAVDAYLFPDGKELSQKRMVPLHILPGRPNADYRATTSPNDPKGRAYIEEYLEGLINQKRKELDSKAAVKVISLVTGNWIGLFPVNKSQSNVLPHPYARGAGHPEFKQKLIDVADEVFVVTPLAKLIRQPINKFNELLEKIGETSKTMKNNPKAYKMINPVVGKTRLITTSRKPRSILAGFSGRLQGEMRQIDGEYKKSESWTLQQFPFDTLANNIREEREIEFPHDYSQNEVFQILFD